jgi:hypothetical protein
VDRGPAWKYFESKLPLRQNAASCKALDLQPPRRLSMFVDLLLARAALYERADLTPQWLAYTRAERIDARMCYPHCGLLAATVCAFFSGRFDFADDNEPDATAAAVIEVLGEDGATIVDLCGWPLAEPTHFATMFGNAFGLGMDRVGNTATYFVGQHLQFYRTPLRWLQAGCNGAVILDLAAAHLWLGGALGNVAGEDRDHAEAIRAAAIPPHLPAKKILAPLGLQNEKRSPRVGRAR